MNHTEALDFVIKIVKLSLTELEQAISVAHEMEMFEDEDSGVFAAIGLRLRHEKSRRDAIIRRQMKERNRSV